MEFAKLFELIIAASLINNFVFTRFLGLCIFFGVSRKMETAVGMSITFTSVMMISSALSWLIFNYIMVPLDITFLKIIIFIGIVAGFVQASDTVMRKVSPGLYYKLGIYLALISTNCIILAVPLINAGEHYSFIESLAFALGSGIGFATRINNNGKHPGKARTCRCPETIQGNTYRLYSYRLDCACIYGFFRIDKIVIW